MTMTMTHNKTTALVLALGLLGACGEDIQTASFDTEGWIDTMPPMPPPPNPSHQDSGDEDDEDGDEDGEEEGDEEGGAEAGASWAIYGAYADGVLSDPFGELFAEDASGVENCVFVFAVTVLSTADDCSSCTAAWELELAQPEIEIDIDGACASYGVDSVAGTVLRLGITNDNLLMRDQGGGWEELGEAFQEEGELILEWPHEEG